MQLKITPENPLEWLALQANLVPVPLLHAQVLPVICKAILVATDRGVFESIEKGAHTIEQLAKELGWKERPLSQLLGVLVSSGYLRFQKSEYFILPEIRKWVLSESKHSVKDLMVYNNRVVWPWFDQLERYLETGVGIDYHSGLSKDQWMLYQSAMYAAAVAEAKEFARKAPGLTAPRQMLDVGGSHGLHSRKMLEKYESLHAVVLDLPEAIEQQNLARAEVIEGRLEYRPGNILTDSLPEDHYDLILISSLVHHFTEEQNRSVVAKLTRALRKGGLLIINEFIRPLPNQKPELVGGSTDLFFGLTSASGNWSVEEIQSWQIAEGLRPLKPIGYRAIPGRYQVAARKR